MSIEEWRQCMEKRYDYVDVIKGIAMIFIYLGHWTTQYITGFAYLFHLQCFFLVSGFFANKQTRRSVKEWGKRNFVKLLVPYFVWVVVSFVFNNLDNAELSLNDFKKIFMEPNSIQPNYWFFPSIIAIITCYYFLRKILSEKFIVILAFFLYLLFGENPIISCTHNFLYNSDSWPVLIRVINNWIAFSSIPQYLFWYSLGSVAFPYVNRFREIRNDSYSEFKIISGVLGLLSVVLLFKGSAIQNRIGCEQLWGGGIKHVAQL